LGKNEIKIEKHVCFFLDSKNNTKKFKENFSFSKRSKTFSLFFFLISIEHDASAKLAKTFVPYQQGLVVGPVKARTYTYGPPNLN